MSPSASNPAHATAAPSVPHGRWVQLVAGVICMSMIANLQYGWTLFVNPMDDKHHWGRAAIQVGFTLYVLTETWLVPIEGYLVDRFGPRIVVVSASTLVAASWVINSFATSLPLIYAGSIIGGIGAGSVYGTCVGNALKWFPDKRGMAAGLTAMGFGAGSALTVIPIAAMIKASGYEAAFLRFGLGQGLVILLVGLLLKHPEAGFSVPHLARARVAPAAREYTPMAMVRTPAFWCMYLMFVLGSTGGLVATAQLTPIAKDFHIAEIPVSLIGITLPALTFALSLDRIFNGGSRWLFGWLSDYLGRENTMFLVFAIEGSAILMLNKFGTNPVAFVLITGLVYLAWGPIYSLFPATVGDTYGRKFAAGNYGLLYTAKGTASLLVPYTSVIAATGGEGWHAVFLAAAIMNFVAAVLALGALRPLRARMRAAADAQSPVAAMVEVAATAASPE